MERVSIQWTETAKAGLAGLPLTIRRGLCKSVGALRSPSALSEYLQLVAPLQDFYRVPEGRYKAVFSLCRDTIPSGDILTSITVQFIATTVPSDSDRRQIYMAARKMLNFLAEPE